MTAAFRRVVSPLGLGALMGALVGCAASRPAELPRAEAALPQTDPAALGTPRDTTPIPGIQQVAVRLERTPNGVQLLEVLSPPLSDAQRAELLEAMARGQAKPATQPPPGTSVWITTIPFPIGKSGGKTSP